MPQQPLPEDEPVRLFLPDGPARAVDRILPAIGAQAARADQTRTVDPDVISALKASEVMKLAWLLDTTPHARICSCSARQACRFATMYWATAGSRALEPSASMASNIGAIGSRRGTVTTGVVSDPGLGGVEAPLVAEDREPAVW